MVEREMVMEVERQDGDEPVGIQLDAGMTVTKVTRGTLADGNIRNGDRVLTINGTRLRNRDDYFYCIRYAHPRLRITYRRKVGGPNRSVMGSIVADPPSLRRPSSTNIAHRPGFTYFTVDFDLPGSQGAVLGITLSNRSNRVVVSSLKEDGLGAEKLRVLDRFLSVNNSFVSDKDVAKTLIQRTGGKFTVLVERPLTEAAKEQHRPRPARNIPPIMTVNWADVGGDPRILPHDCLHITKMEREKPKVWPGPGILRRPGLRSQSRVSVAPSHSEFDIARDTHPNKRLRPVPRSNK